MLKTGTVVKLFDYQVGSKFLSFKGARDTLNENLVETILPFRRLDFRQLPKTKQAREAAQKRDGDRAEGMDPRPFYGMEFLLLRSHKEEGLEDEEEDAAGESKISVGIIKDPDLGTVSVSAIPLKRTIPGWLKAPQNINRVFHTVNGQVQYKQSRGYLSRCGFSALMDRVVIVVDASNLTFSAHNKVWKGDREHISNTMVGERYLWKGDDDGQGIETLLELQKKIAQLELERAYKAESNELFQKLVDSDRNLGASLPARPDNSCPLFGRRRDRFRDRRRRVGRRQVQPPFVRLEKRHKKEGLAGPINRTRPVSARTDAENGYLNRTDNPGQVIIDEEVRKKFGIRQHLTTGGRRFTASRRRASSRSAIRSRSKSPSRTRRWQRPSKARNWCCAWPMNIRRHHPRRRIRARTKTSTNTPKARVKTPRRSGYRSASCSPRTAGTLRGTASSPGPPTSTSMMAA